DCDSTAVYTFLRNIEISKIGRSCAGPTGDFSANIDGGLAWAERVSATADTTTKAATIKILCIVSSFFDAVFAKAKAPPSSNVTQPFGDSCLERRDLLTRSRLAVVWFDQMRKFFDELLTPASEFQVTRFGKRLGQSTAHACASGY
ncbi:MAG: hypothetical protein ACR2PG_24390, partial [Hyphomicrobiaceae bacterium]